MDTDRSLFLLIPKLLKHWKLILGTSLLTGVLTAIVMLGKPNYFRSTALFYPVNSALLSPIMDMRDQYQGYFGNDKDVDRLLSISNSRTLVDQIIDEFNLADHYKIDASSPKGQQKLYLQFKKLFDVHKTEFDAISLSVEDTDPILAQKLSKSLLDKIDTQAGGYGISSQGNIVTSLNRDILQKEEQLAELSDTITRIRKKYGIYDTNVQAEALAELEINSPSNSSVQRKIQNYNSGIAELMRFEITYDELSRSIVYHQIQYDKIKNNIGHGVSVLHVIEQPTLPLTKSRPHRSLYVLGAMIFMGLVSCAYVLIKEQLGQVYYNQ